MKNILNGIKKDQINFEKICKTYAKENDLDEYRINGDDVFNFNNAKNCVNKWIEKQNDDALNASYKEWADWADWLKEHNTHEIKSRTENETYTEYASNFLP